MSRLSPQVMVQFTRRLVHQELKWKPTALHAPEIPDSAVTDDPTAGCAPLDVRFLQQMGFRAFYNEVTGTSAWPVPLGMTPYELALFGKAHGILHREPEGGDIFLQRGFRRSEYVHAGLVMTVDGKGVLDERIEYFETSTCEGDTDHRGMLHCGHTAKLRRRLSPTQGDRFLRWCDLEVANDLTINERVA